MQFGTKSFGLDPNHLVWFADFHRNGFTKFIQANMVKQTKPCDPLRQQLKLIECWSLEAEASNILPESAVSFNSHLSASTRTSTVWNGAALLSAASHASNFTVDVDDRWTDEKVVRKPYKPCTRILCVVCVQTTTQVVLVAPTGRKKSAVANAHLQANAMCEKLLDVAYVSNVG